MIPRITVDMMNLQWNPFGKHVHLTPAALAALTIKLLKKITSKTIGWALQLFFSKQGVQLIVTRATDWDSDVAILPHFLFHFFVVAHPGN